MFCVVATAGTTSTGSVDPIQEIGEVCREVGAWLHVDGAYGLAYGLVPEKAHLFKGLDQADTIAWDPHKQMGVPIPNSILFARDRELFKPMALFSHYWNRADAQGAESWPQVRSQYPALLRPSPGHLHPAPGIERGGCPSPKTP